MDAKMMERLDALLDCPCKCGVCQPNIQDIKDYLEKVHIVEMGEGNREYVKEWLTTIVHVRFQDSARVV